MRRDPLRELLPETEGQAVVIGYRTLSVLRNRRIVASRRTERNRPTINAGDHLSIVSQVVACVSVPSVRPRIGIRNAGSMVSGVVDDEHRATVQFLLYRQVPFLPLRRFDGTHNRADGRRIELNSSRQIVGNSVEAIGDAERRG